MLEKITKFELSAEMISSLFVMLLILIMCFVIYFKCKKVNPLERPKGLMLIVEWAVEKLDKWVNSLMGESFDGWGGYFMAIMAYMFTAFIWGLTGFASPFMTLVVPLSLSFILFILIHATSVRYTKWKYFKRYVDPFAFFLPINLISMWAPLISTCLRMFGNATCGWVVMGLLYYVLNTISYTIIKVPGISIAPFVTSVLHLYFDLFGAYIQTLVFCSLSALFIAQEKPEVEDIKTINQTMARDAIS